MTHEPETIDQAAAKAQTRWRVVAGGLAIVLATNIINAGMNAAQLARTPPVICVAAINDPALAKKAVEQRVDQDGRRFVIPR